MLYVNIKFADHPRSLISFFVVNRLDSMMPVFDLSEIPILLLSSVAEQASLSLTLSHSYECRFFHDVARYPAQLQRLARVLKIRI